MKACCLPAALLLSFGLANAKAQPAPPIDAPTSGAMTFDDEFDRFDGTKYSTSFLRGHRWLGAEEGEEVGELQVYVDPAYTGSGTKPLGLDPFSIRKGVLDIQATIPSPTVLPYLQGQKYISGVLTTYRTFSQRYGYFETRARLPRGKGFHPTLWLLPKVIMPKPPEIDIVEAKGSQLNTLYVTAHWNDPNKRHQVDGFTISVPDMSEDFHRYGLLWTPTWLAWYFDGKRVAYRPTPFGMNSSMYMLLTFAVGGWGESPDGTTAFPGDFQIDYLRVYPWK